MMKGHQRRRCLFWCHRELCCNVVAKGNALAFPFLCYRKLRHSIVVTNKNCEAILASAPAKSVRFFKLRDETGGEYA